MGNIIGAVRPIGTGKKIAVVLTALAVGTALALTGTAVQPAEAHAATKAPAKVTAVKAKAKSTTSIKVTWKRAKDAKTYQLAYKESGSKSWKTKTVKSKSATVKKLADNAKYTFKVRGAAGKEKGKWSSARSCATKAATPAKVTGLSAKATSEGKAKLTWSKSKHADAYEVSYSIDGGSWRTKTTSSASLTVSGLSSGAKVQAKVRGLNEGAKAVKGTWSEAVAIKAPHVHDWEEVYETVHHDAVTVEMPLYESAFIARCNTCNGMGITTEFADTETYETLGDYYNSEFSKKLGEHDELHDAKGEVGSGYASGWFTYTNNTYRIVGYETREAWPAYDEDVLTGYKCDDCGASKAA